MWENKAATLTAQTKIIFAVTRADAQVLAEDFVPLEQRRRPVNLDVTPLSSMDRHPNAVVKEFANLYGRALEAGARDRIQYPHYSARELHEPYYKAHPKPKFFPSRDFGAGRVMFDPSDAARVLSVLNELLYETQKSGRIDPQRQARVIEQMAPLLDGYDSGWLRL